LGVRIKNLLPRAIERSSIAARFVFYCAVFIEKILVDTVQEEHDEEI